MPLLASVLLPIGLGLDIIGFSLVLRYGHALFILTGTGPPPTGSEWIDGDLYFQVAEGKEATARRRFFRPDARMWAKVGGGLVILGFMMQFVTSLLILA